jgi:hypothetical protein
MQRRCPNCGEAGEDREGEGASKMNMPIGWYVRVWVGNEESDDPAYDTALYIVGCHTPDAAVEAVRKFRGKSGERLEVLEGEILAGATPSPQCPTQRR